MKVDWLLVAIIGCMVMAVFFWFVVYGVVVGVIAAVCGALLLTGLVE